MKCYFCKQKVKKHNKTTIKFKKANGDFKKVPIHKTCPTTEGGSSNGKRKID